MQALAERARQALGVGRDVFVASSLEAHEATLKELEVFVGPLESMLKAAEHFRGATQEFLDSSATYINKCPFPRLWVQAALTEPAVALHVPAPVDQAAWFDAETHETVAQMVPGSVSYAIQRELIEPMKQWLLAYEVAKGTYSHLERRRLSYDAARRRLVNAAAKAATEETHDVAAAAAGRQEVLVVTGGPQLAQLQEAAAATTPELAEYETEVEALDDALLWLASGAARLKALVADAAGSAAEAAKAWEVPPGIMPPLPEKTTIGQDIDVTMTVSEPPLGELGTPTATTSVQQVVTHQELGTPAATTSVVTHQEGAAEGPTDSSGSGSTASGAKGTPELSRMLPSDEMVYGGGIAPPAAAHVPTGGGLLDVTKVSVTTTAATGKDSDHSEADSGDRDKGQRHPTTPAADLSGTLPSDEMVYGGGVAPPAAAHPPTGGGLLDVIKDAVLPTGAAGAAGSSDEGQRHPTTTAADLSGTLPSDEMVHGGGMAPPAPAHTPGGGGPSDSLEDTLESSESVSSDEAEPEAHGLHAAPAAPETVAWPSRSYSGEGVGRVEVTSPKAHEALDRAASRSTGLAASPEVTVAEPEKKQLSAVVLPTTATESLAAVAAAAGTSSSSTTAFNDNSSTQALPTAAAATATSTAAETATSAAAETQGVHSSSSSSPKLKPGGIIAAIAKTLTDATVALTGRPSVDSDTSSDISADSVGGGDADDHITQHAPVEGFSGRNLPQGAATTAADDAAADQQQQQLEVQEGEREHEATSGEGIEFKVQGVEETAAGYEGTWFGAGPTAPGGGMHVGPVPSAAESPPAPGSALWVKDATLPGGAAAGGVGLHHTAEQTGQGDMHIGPVPSAAEGPPAPGSAVWVKDATLPGGEAAAAAQHTGPTPRIPPPTAASFFKGAPMAPTTTDTGSSSSSAPEPSSTAAVPVAAEGILLSDTTTMGEAAGPATTTGSSVSVMTPAASATATTPAEAPAGESDSTEGKGGPDLSKVLPSYEKLPGGSKAKPSGGGVGALLRDTLLGPRPTEQSK